MKRKRGTIRRVLRRVAIVILVLFVLIQFVPYGRDHTAPAGTQEPVWDSPTTRVLFFKACKDCHSNETHWPWYSQIAPVSWLVQNDVDEGREHLNVSDWAPGRGHGDEAAEEVQEGEMPLLIYRIMHADARLSEQDKAALIAGLSATFGGGEHEDDKGEDDD